MLNRLLQNLKHRSNVTLRQWSYQCEYIIAQRSRRFQQLLTFYHRVWGDNGFKELLRSYRMQFQPPIRGLLLSAVGALAFDWDKERIKLTNFEVCRPDMDFIDRLQCSSSCEHCRKRAWRFCYCASNTSDRIWEPYVTKENFTIWRREEKPSLYAYKVYVKYDDVTVNDFLSVQTDLEYRKQWDGTAVKLEVIESDPQPETNSHLIYWEMQWPRLFANRDYVYCRRVYTDIKRNAIYIYNQSTTHPKYPNHPDKVRVNEYWSYMVIKPYENFNDPGIHYVLTYFDDPGLSIPAQIKSWVTQSQMPEFLNRLYAATKKYARMKKKERAAAELPPEFHITDPDYTANAHRDRKSQLRTTKIGYTQKGKYSTEQPTRDGCD